MTATTPPPTSPHTNTSIDTGTGIRTSPDTTRERGAAPPGQTTPHPARAADPRTHTPPPTPTPSSPAPHETAPGAGQDHRPRHPRPEDPDRRSRAARAGAGALLTLIAAGLAVVIATPVALSSQDLIAWAGAPTGLDLPTPWPVLVFVALDAASAVCVLLSVYCAWRGEPAGVFAILVWAFAFTSAFANWRHSSTPTAAPDAAWFFPTMSLAGPTLLEAVLGRLRRWTQREHGRRARTTPAFGWRRWTPGIGALRDTYGAYRTALLLDLDTVHDAVSVYHRLCPDGSLRIATALRHHHNQPTNTPHPDARPATTGNPRTGHDHAATPTHTHATHTPPSERAPAALPPADRVDLPANLIRRLPVQPQTYQRWRRIWTDLQHTTDPAGHQPADPADGRPTDQATAAPADTPLDRDQLTEIAERHGVSVRHIEVIRRAGRSGLLNSPTPPALGLTIPTLPADPQPDADIGAGAGVGVGAARDAPGHPPTQRRQDPTSTHPPRRTTTTTPRSDPGPS